MKRTLNRESKGREAAQSISLWLLEVWQKRCSLSSGLGGDFTDWPPGCVREPCALSISLRRRCVTTLRARLCACCRSPSPKRIILPTTACCRVTQGPATRAPSARPRYFLIDCREIGRDDISLSPRQDEAGFFLAGESVRAAGSPVKGRSVCSDPVRSRCDSCCLNRGAGACIRSVSVCGGDLSLMCRGSLSPKRSGGLCLNDLRLSASGQSGVEISSAIGHVSKHGPRSIACV